MKIRKNKKTEVIRYNPCESERIQKIQENLEEFSTILEAQSESGRIQKNTEKYKQIGKNSRESERIRENQTESG